MKACIDKNLGAMLYAYELGMLSDEQTKEFELHLINCQYCSEHAGRLLGASRLIRNDIGLHEYIADLDQQEIQPSPETSERKVRRKFTISYRYYALAVTAAILIFLLLIDWDIKIFPEKTAHAAENRLTILHFTNMTGSSDADYFVDIITNLLITNLGESRYFRVTSSRHLQNIYNSLGIRGDRNNGTELSFKIGRESRAKWILTGEILKSMPEPIISYQLVETGSGDVLASRRFVGRAGEDVFAVIDRLSAEIKGRLPLPVEAKKESSRSVAEITTHSPQAYRLYMEGVELKARFFNDEAVEKFQQALEYDSTMAMAYFYLASLLHEDFITKALLYSDNASRREKYHIDASYQLIEGKPKNAIESLLRLIEEYPDEAYAYWRIGMIYTAQKEYLQAVPYFEDAVAIDPYYKEAYNSLAYAYENTGEWDKSIITINKYIEIAPNEPNPYDTRADLYARKGEIQKAMASYRQALKIRPDFYFSLEKLGCLYLYTGDYFKADSCFKILSVDGNYGMRARGRFWLAAANIRRGMLLPAVASLDSSVSIDIGDSEFDAACDKYFLKSLIFLELNDFNKAAENGNKIEEITLSHASPFVYYYHSLYIQILAGAGKMETANNQLELLKSHLEESNNDLTEYWYAKGCIDFYNNDFDSAISDFNAGLETTDGFQYQFMLARSYFEYGQFGHAAEIFKSIVDDYSRERLKWPLWNVKLHYYLGRTYEESRWPDKAIEQYEKFLSLWGNISGLNTSVADAKKRITKLKNDT